MRVVPTSDALICLRRLPGLAICANSNPFAGLTLEPATGEVQPGLGVRVGLVLADRAALDLEVDDGRCRLPAGLFLDRLEVEVAEDRPFLSVVRAVNAVWLLGVDVADMSLTWARSRIDEVRKKRMKWVA